MDKDRQIRFLYPPLIFLGSLALGLWLAPPSQIGAQIEKLFGNDNKTSVAVALFGAGSLVLVLGFLLGTITVLLLRSFFPRNRFNYEFKLSDKIYDRIGELILKDKSDSIRKKDRMYAAIVFDHSYVHENTHRWIIRRWNAFFIASSSTVALTLSLIIGSILHIQVTCAWFFIVFTFIILFIIQGYSSWKETMRMVAFMTRVKKENLKSDKPTDTQQEEPKGVD